MIISRITFGKWTSFNNFKDQAAHLKVRDHEQIAADPDRVDTDIDLMDALFWIKTTIVSA